MNATVTKLNEKEFQVLTACAKEVINCSGVSFGMLDMVEVDGINVKQMKGYISQLTQKGYITLCGSKDNRTVSLTDTGVELLLEGVEAMVNSCYMVDLLDIKANL
jgi:predicted transcriptional regulator